MGAGYDPEMEIIPGVGVEAVKIGDPRGEVEQGLGPPVHAGSHARCVHGSVDPMLVVTYGQDDLVELVEVGYGADGQAFFDGVQLTYRFMDDVMADLAAKGHLGTPSDIGFDLQAGFAIFSMASLSAQELDPDAPDGEPAVVLAQASDVGADLVAAHPVPGQPGRCRLPRQPVVRCHVHPERGPGYHRPSCSPGVQRHDDEPQLVELAAVPVVPRPQRLHGPGHAVGGERGEAADPAASSHGA